MRSKLLTMVLLSLVVTPACASESSSATAQGGAVSLETDDERILYTLGQILGDNVASVNLTEDELAIVVAGFSDNVLGRDEQVPIDDYGPLLQAFMQGRMEAASEAELVEATAFVEQQAATAGATQTDSGIVITEVVAGDGANPAETDTVTVHYHGTLRDGTVFDSSVERGEPATFPLNQVIPCWREAVQTIKVGGTSRIVCPPDMAYGPVGPPGIPGNAALMFEVELLGIE